MLIHWMRLYLFKPLIVQRYNEENSILFSLLITPSCKIIIFITTCFVVNRMKMSNDIGILILIIHIYQPSPVNIIIISIWYSEYRIYYQYNSLILRILLGYLPSPVNIIIISNMKV